MSSRWRQFAAIAAAVVVADQATKLLAVEHLTYATQFAGAKSLPAALHAFLTERDLSERGLTGEPITVFRSWFSLRYVQNRGAAWGILTWLPQGARIPFFIVVVLVASAFILSTYRKLEPGQRLQRLALPLILGGAIGNNLLDRPRLGYVVDFIDWHWRDPLYLDYARHWPTFNVADVGVSVGVSLLLLESLLVKRAARGNRVAVAAPSKR